MESNAHFERLALFLQDLFSHHLWSFFGKFDFFKAR